MAKKYDAHETIVALSNVLEDDIAETALAALSNVVRATPVGDPKLWQNPGSAPPGYVGGHARRNWQVSLQASSDLIVGSPGSGLGAGGATAEAVNKGTNVIERANPRNTSRIIIQNSVPYIGRLNNGHSEQAPVNFVEMAVQAASQKLANDRKNVP